MDQNLLWNIIMTIIATCFGFVILLYFFTPVLDEWVIQNSLNRLCTNLKEDFSGEEYSPAYLCTFMEPTE